MFLGLRHGNLIKLICPNPYTADVHSGIVRVDSQPWRRPAPTNR